MAIGGGTGAFLGAKGQGGQAREPFTRTGRHGSAAVMAPGIKKTLPAANTE
jgi:hypothetical protein